MEVYYSSIHEGLQLISGPLEKAVLYLHFALVESHTSASDKWSFPYTFQDSIADCCPIRNMVQFSRTIITSTRSNNKVLAICVFRQQIVGVECFKVGCVDSESSWSKPWDLENAGFDVKNARHPSPILSHMFSAFHEIHHPIIDFIRTFQGSQSCRQVSNAFEKSKDIRVTLSFVSKKVVI